MGKRGEREKIAKKKKKDGDRLVLCTIPLTISYNHTAPSKVQGTVLVTKVDLCHQEGVNVGWVGGGNGVRAPMFSMCWVLGKRGSVLLCSFSPSPLSSDCFCFV